MKNQIQIKILLILNIIGSVGLLIWWFLFPLLLPIKDASENFQYLILDDNWIVLNLAGLISCLLLCLGLPGIFLAYYREFNLRGFIGILLACTGLVLFTAIQYYETLIWPVAAQVNPELLHTNGALVSGSSAIVAGLLVSGIILGIGYILFGSAALKVKKYKILSIWLLMIGAVIFGNGIIFSIRTLGLVFFTGGNLWISVQTIRN